MCVRCHIILFFEKHFETCSHIIVAASIPEVRQAVDMALNSIYYVVSAAKCGYFNTESHWKLLLHYITFLNCFNNKIITRSSPQWWSGRSTTAHNVLDLCSLIWGFDESSMIVHGITLQPSMCVILKCAVKTFSSISTLLAEICKGNFWPLTPPPRFGGREPDMSGIGPFYSPPMCSYQLRMVYLWPFWGLS